MVAAKAVASKAAAAKDAVKAGTHVFTKVVAVSPALRKILGAGDVNRGDVLKKVWSYVKEHKLQNPENGKEIVCDDKLKVVFGKERVGFLEVQKLLAPHIPKAES